MIKPIIKLFDKHVLFWESPKIIQRISSFLVISFIVCGICSSLVYYNLLSVGPFNNLFKHPFFAIEVAFTILLILELLSLIFVLPKSVSRSLGKQFELLSLIFLRDAFKEFSHLDNFLLWNDAKETIQSMLVYSFGGLAIFTVMGFTHRLNSKIRLSETYVNQTQFVRVKKLLALFLLISFFLIGIRDFLVLVQTGTYLHSFDTFYTVLIFTDIIIVLVALRYTINYYRVFRYTAFVLATILIRISLTIEPYYNVVLGVLASVFVLILAVVYNHFQKWLTKRELTT
ncbi:hypothetical protein GTQ34_10690 [Muricauda sp. JGD-17]|uniref:Uncharacterized protein n=2 Tax=Flagellimonas ochracea TaxID=2696472 RepID=A0A964TCM5_9FLAO|nr:hypothetical protein [Allomuricauda ochracea]